MQRTATIRVETGLWLAELDITVSLGVCQLSDDREPELEYTHFELDSLFVSWYTDGTLAEYQETKIAGKSAIDTALHWLAPLADWDKLLEEAGEDAAYNHTMESINVR